MNAISYSEQLLLNVEHRTLNIEKKQRDNKEKEDLVKSEKKHKRQTIDIHLYTSITRKNTSKLILYKKKAEYDWVSHTWT